MGTTPDRRAPVASRHWTVVFWSALNRKALDDTLSTVASTG
jgi:hypothetical protein